ncbi:MAG: hypothetical protein ACRDZR_08600 [Acidimicrobiales bacterium]
MSDLISLSRGRKPWDPALGSDLVAVYNTYDGPLLGVIEQDGVQYLFECIYGHVESLSLWLYSSLRPGCQQLLESLSGDAFDQMVKQVQKSAGARLSLVVEGLGIVAVADAVDFPGDLPTAVHELVADYRNTVERLQSTESEAEDLESRKGKVLA